LKEALGDEELCASLGKQVRAKALAEMGWEGARRQFEHIYATELERIRKPQPKLVVTPSADSSTDAYEEGASVEEVIRASRKIS
jgi:hypothetical protein